MDFHVVSLIQNTKEGCIVCFIWLLEASNMKAGFIHVPFSSKAVANKDRPLASMPIETIAKSLEHAIEAVVKE